LAIRRSLGGLGISEPIARAHVSRGLRGLAAALDAADGAA
jgi:hypothetical protein